MRILSLLLLPASCVAADSANHHYTMGQSVELWVDTVGPYRNPQETYEYYTLPYCAPQPRHHPEANRTGKFNELKVRSIGEILGGYQLRHSGHDFKFDPGNTRSESCTTRRLTARETEKFADAARHRWFYQMYLDDLPVWGMVGEMLPPAPTLARVSGIEDKEMEHSWFSGYGREQPLLDPLTPHIYTTRHLIVAYNGDQIVMVDLVSDPKSLEEVKEEAQFTFTLFISFIPTTTEEFDSRFDRYIDHEFFTHPIQVVIILVVGVCQISVVATVLRRTLHKDFARYGLLSDDSNIDLSKPLVESEDSGWKQLHGDVFRTPRHFSLLTALVANGWQLVMTSFCVLFYAVALNTHIYESRGGALPVVLICYALSSLIAGYTGRDFFALYHDMNSNTKLWQSTMNLTALFFPIIGASIFTVLKAASLCDHYTVNIMDFTVSIKLFAIYVFVNAPLFVLGTRLSQRFSSVSDGHFPCRVNQVPRPIPKDVPYYGKPYFLIPLCGLVSVLYVTAELGYVMMTLWNYEFYIGYGSLVSAFGMLMMVASSMAILVAYLCLNAENHLWQWPVFLAGASTGGYVFIYGMYYYFFVHTRMTGFFQTSYYFGCMLLISLHVGLMCGCVGHAAASRFVRAIFKNIKSE